MNEMQSKKLNSFRTVIANINCIVCTRTVVANQVEFVCIVVIAGLSVQVWMLTGDKLETATCTAKNAHLITRNQDIHIFRPVSGKHFCCFCSIFSFFVPVYCSIDSGNPWATHPVCTQGLFVCGHSAPHNYTCSPSQQHPQLNKSPPTSESIQASVRGNKQAVAWPERRNQLKHSHREHAAGSLPNLFFSFQAVIALIVPSAFLSGTAPEPRERVPYRKVATCAQLWLLEGNNNGWQCLKTSVPEDMREC